jgi:tetratricopeptide (TPR) repeat protein
VTPLPARGVTGTLFPAILLSLLLALSACARVPKIIILEDPLSADEHVTLGVAYERNGELDLAAREYEAALRKDAAFFQARFNLGNVRLAQKRYDAAREEYLQGLGLRPADPEATNNLAWAAILSGSEREDALRRMESVLENPERRSPPLLDTLGVLLGEFSRPVEAEQAFAEAERMCGARDPACTDAVAKEIREHREALRARFPVPAGGAPLVE